MIDSEEKHFTRLTDMVQWSYQQDRPARQIHNDINEAMMGEYYPIGGGLNGIETPINLLSMAKRAMSRSLISKAPRVMANTDREELKSFAEDAEISANQRIIKSDAARILRDATDQSMVSAGIVLMMADYVGDNDGMKLSLVMKSIDRCDYVFDPGASSLEDSDIQGHKFRMVIQDVVEHPWFEPERRDVEPSPPNYWSSEDKASNRTSTSGGQTELYDYVDIWMVYERRRRKIVVFPCHQQGIKLMEMDWNGPDHGPYRYLYYEKPVGLPLPISPMMHLLKKHRAFNVLDAKTIHQQHTSKWNLFYSNASKEDAKRMVESYDNQSVLQENGAVRGAHIGGASQDTVLMSEKQKRDFSYQAFNMDQYAGLASQADTLGQERLLAGAANEMLEDMRGYAYQFVKGFCEDIYWFDIRDPDTKERKLRRKIPDTNLSYDSDWSIVKRQFVADMQFQIDVEPYSYRERSPESRLADCLGALEIYERLAGQAAAQGMSLDVQSVMDTVIKYRNLPEVNDWLIRNQDPQELSGLLGGQGDSKPKSASPRRYIRESRSDGAGRDMEMMRNLGANQGSEMMAV